MSSCTPRRAPRFGVDVPWVPASQGGMTCGPPHYVPPCSAGPRASHPPARLASAKHPRCAAGPSHLWGYAWRSPARHRGTGCRAQQTVLLDEFLGPEKHAGRAARSKNLSACFCRPNFHHEHRRYLGTVHGLFWFYDIDFGARYSLCLKVYCKVDPKAPEQLFC